MHAQEVGCFIQTASVTVVTCYQECWTALASSNDHYGPAEAVFRNIQCYSSSPQVSIISGGRVERPDQHLPYKAHPLCSSHLESTSLLKEFTENLLCTLSREQLQVLLTEAQAWATFMAEVHMSR
ncbi:hypothetical protein J0S82_010809 [Galemys pyrenaicus]|uniref:Uncharacterized protein n=1 Tax=Galemys pyrenaicus TaxID=202257 RepID=A0A8J6DZR7_GALPY|nr:hypothetical protein J0S82_010809 [Galemys pyrenaicus]